MHDSLGHDLALIAVRAGVLEVDPGLGPEQQRAAGELRRAAAEATERLRDVVGVLREEGAGAPTAPADETVGDLVDRARASGLDVTLSGEALSGEAHSGAVLSGEAHSGAVLSGEAHSGVVPELPGMAGRALHRVVQEGLTNAAKHAPGAAVTVEVRETGERVTVRVVSGPGAGSGPPASGGSGLVGLDERVRLAGGTLTHGPVRGGGFALTAVLPRRAPAAVPAAPTSARELDRARRRVRKDLVRAIWIPLALLAALAVLTAGVAVWSQSRSYLEPDNYARLLVGQAYAELVEDLPDHALERLPAGLPPEPGGVDECRHYRATVFAERPVYRLCFAAGRLVSRDELG
ncbi:sensor histidine kinase [Streptomyces sp. NPDC093105]|uniref:sensor histidine kinase n=1 Tax=Streptomyces sp. NPDC093105 TaxID=3366029 RepID=UPI003808D194